MTTDELAGQLARTTTLSLDDARRAADLGLWLGLSPEQLAPLAGYGIEFMMAALHLIMSDRPLPREIRPVPASSDA